MLLLLLLLQAVNTDSLADCLCYVLRCMYIHTHYIYIRTYMVHLMVVQFEAGLSPCCRRNKVIQLQNPVGIVKLVFYLYVVLCSAIQSMDDS